MKTKMKVQLRFLNTSEGTIEDTNLINNGGLDMLASNYVANVFRYAQMGTGTRANYRISGTDNLVTQAGTLVTCTSSFFVAADATNNRVIIFANGAKATITAFTSGTQVTVAASQGVAAQDATVYYVKETALETATEVIGTCVAGLNGSTIALAGNTLTIEDKRTFDFGTAAADTLRSEFGWGPTNTLGAAIFGRVVKDVTWLATTSIQVEVTLTRIIDCSIVTIGSLPLTGATFASTSRIMFGNTTLQGTDYRSTVNATDGASVIGAQVAGSMLEPFSAPATGRAISVSDTVSSLDFTNIADTSTGDDANWTVPAYVAGNFYRDLTVSFISSSYTSVVWRTIALWVTSQAAQFRILFDANQTFNGDITNLIIRNSWDRT